MSTKMNLMEQKLKDTGLVPGSWSVPTHTRFALRLFASLPFGASVPSLYIPSFLVRARALVPKVCNPPAISMQVLSIAAAPSQQQHRPMHRQPWRDHHSLHSARVLLLSHDGFKLCNIVTYFCSEWEEAMSEARERASAEGLKELERMERARLKRLEEDEEINKHVRMPT